MRSYLGGVRGKAIYKSQQKNSWKEILLADSLKMLQSLFLIVLVALAEAGKNDNVKYVSHKNCNGLRKGSIIAHPTDCSKYVICNGLRSTLGDCSAGYFYNENMLSCEKIQQKQQQESCAAKADIQTTYAPATVATTTTTTLELENKETITTTSFLTPAILSNFGRPICKGNHKYYIMHPLNCSLYYYCASRGNALLRRCNKGYSWDWLRQRCLKSSVALCYGSSM